MSYLMQENTPSPRDELQDRLSGELEDALPDKTDELQGDALPMRGKEQLYESLQCMRILEIGMDRPEEKHLLAGPSETKDEAPCEHHAATQTGVAVRHERAEEDGLADTNTNPNKEEMPTEACTCDLKNGESTQMEEERPILQDRLLLEAAMRASVLDQEQKTQAFENEASRLILRASARNLTEIKVPADGNCQFHSLSQSLAELNAKSSSTNPDPDHLEVRHLLVEWLQSNAKHQLRRGDPDTMICYYLDEDPDWEAYCERMSKKGQYGDHLTLIAAAECFKHRITVITSEPDGVDYTIHPCRASIKGTIYLAHYSFARHYNRLVKMATSGGQSTLSSLVQSTANSVVLQREHPLLSNFAFLVTCPDGLRRRIRTEYNALESSLTIGYQQLREHIARVYGVECELLMLKWKDRDGDLITFDTEAELLNAVRCTAAAAEKVLRICADVPEKY